jgi:hypothetical protein
MYKLLRNTHLLTGVFAFLFLMMYGVSSVQMSHTAWFNLRPATSESEIAMDPGVASPRDLARRLMDRDAVRGELAQIQPRPDGYSFRVIRPGTVHEVTYASATGAAKIRTNVAGFMGMLNRIHHVGGLWHEYTITNLWGLFTGLTAALLIVLALTGIYLWFKIHSERLIGSILLTVSLAFSLTLIFLIRGA